MKYAILLTTLLFLIPTAPAIAASGGSAGGSLPQRQPVVRLTPEEKAAVSYQDGIKHRDKAMKLEQKAGGETREKKLAKLQKKIGKEYDKSIKNYEKAIKYYPHFFEVHSSLGYSLRKVGRYDESLAAYNESLRINPSYGNAIEYRGEAYLGLNRIADAKDAYMVLFQSEPALADQLLTAMVEWVASRRSDAGGLDSEDVEQFADWVQQRGELASFVRPLDGGTSELWAETS